MERKHLKRKSAKSYPRRSENKRELLKASNETQKAENKEQSKKLSPEARNKRELLKASNEPQKPQKKERKKFSPEARKQTRASESLK